MPIGLAIIFFSFFKKKKNDNLSVDQNVEQLEPLCTVDNIKGAAAVEGGMAIPQKS